MPSIVSLDNRGRITIPKEIRSKIKAKRFLVVLDGKNIVLIPVSDIERLKGSLKIPWSIEELEEAGEEFVTKRS
ncbi:MAG: AbrB/MazE/SpoVT family DNA-binding domain-containing protein [Candidatus Asgardarchaeia archaeon]